MDKYNLTPPREGRNRPCTSSLSLSKTVLETYFTSHDTTTLYPGMKTGRCSSWCVVVVVTYVGGWMDMDIWMAGWVGVAAGWLASLVVNPVF